MARKRHTRLIASPAAWIEALFDPAGALDVEMYGYHVLDASWRIESRTLTCHLIYFIRDGYAEGRVGPRAVRLEAESILWVSPGVRHEFRFPEGGPPLRLYNLRFFLRRGGASLRMSQPAMIQSGAGELHTYMAQIRDELDASLPQRDARLRALLALLFTHLFRGKGGPDEKGPVLTRDQRERLALLIRQSEPDWLSPRDLAGELRLSLDYFSRMFRRTYGLPPRRWLLRERVRRAAMRLEETNLNVSEVAYQLGYADVFLFSRQFKQVTGMSPTAYRKRR